MDIDSHDEARLWPASPFDLADAHRCPSCFAVISATPCGSCGFELTDPRALRVLELGREILSTELARQRLIDDIRLTSTANARLAAAEAAVTDAAPLPPTVISATMAADVAVPAEVAEMGAAGTMAGPHVSSGIVAPPVVDQPVTASTFVAAATVGDAVADVDAASVADAVAQPRIPEGGPAVPAPTPATVPSGAGPIPPSAVTSSAPRRRLTVPVLLLIVGVSLVGIAAVFFLLLAWFVMGIEARALIIGGITLATVVLASWLRRRDLGATAEAIGVLGVGLLALDAWAVRANDLFGAGSTDPAVYAGISALVVAVLCRLWSRISGLRGPDLAASLALPAGLAFLVGGLIDLPTAEAVTAGFLGAAAGGLAHALPAPWSAARSGSAGVPERLVLALAGVGSLIGAAVTAAVATGDAAPVVVWCAALVAVLGAAHAWAARPRAGVEPLPGAVVIAGVASSVAAAAVGLAGWFLALRLDEPVFTVFVGPVLAVTVAVALDLARTLRASSALVPATLTAAGIGCLSIAGSLVLWLLQAQSALASGWTLWRTDAFALPLSAPEAPLIGVAAAVTMAGLLFAAPTLRRPLLSDLRAVVVTLLLLTAAARTAIPAVLVGTALLIAVAALVGAARASARLAGEIRAASPGDGAAPAAPAESAAGAPGHRRRLPRAASLEGSSIAGAIAVVTAFVAGTATPWLWLIGVAAAAAYPVLLRTVRRAAGPLAVVLALAPVAVAVVAAIIAPAALGAATGLTGSAPAVSLALLQWVALATLVAAAFLRIDTASRIGLAISGYALTTLTLVWTLVAAADDVATDAATAATVAAIGEPLVGLVRGVALLALLALIAMRRTRLRGHAVPAAALLAAPAIAALSHSALDMAGASDEGWATLVLAAGPVLVTIATAAIAVLLARTEYGTPAGPDASRPATAPSRTPDPGTADLGTTDLGTADLGTAVQGTPAARPIAPLRARTAADLGALLTGLCIVWGIAPDLVWALLALIALACGAASVTRGWAAPPAIDPADDRFATRRAGLPVRTAPRRLLAWPAAVAACAAWWALLGAGTPDADFALEAYAVPVTVLLAGFAAVLVRLRRRAEASIALGAALTVGLVWPALTAWGAASLFGVSAAGEEPLFGTVVALVAALMCLLLALAPVRGIRPPSVVGSTVALFALTLASVDRAVDWSTDAWPWQSAWLALPVAVGYASGVGFAGARPERMSSRGYAVAAPPIALAAAALVVLGFVGHGAVVAGALAVLLAAHLASAALAWAPFARATRWTALTGAIAVAGVSVLAGGTREIEFATLPVAAACGLGAILAVRRRRRAGATWPAGEQYVWSAALALATVPSLLVAAEPARVWLLIGIALIAAVAISQTPIPDAWRVRVPSALILAAAALAMGVRVLLDPWFAAGDAAAATAAVGAVVVAVSLTATAVTFAEARVAAWLAAAGVALLAATTLLRAGDDAGVVAVTVAIAGAAAVAGAAALGLRRWVALGAVLAVGGLVVVAVGCGVRFLAVAGDPGFEADLWVVAGAAIAVAVATAAMRATTSRRVDLTVGTGLAVAAVLVGAAEVALLAGGTGAGTGTGTGTDELRTVTTMTILTAAAYVGAVWRGRLGAAPAIVAALTAAVFGTVAFFAFGIDPVELVTVPAALGGIAYGARTLRRRPEARTWPTLGPWLALLLLPSLLYDFFGEAELWRIVALGVVAVGLVVVGAVFGLQAPLVLGSAVVLVHGIAQLWPLISTSYVAVPWWLWLGIGGAVLIFIAARYERRVQQLRAAITAVTSLR